MPPLIQTPELFMIPDTSISWASMMIGSLIVLDVSTELGEYHNAIQQSNLKWPKHVKRSINIAALQVVVIGMILIILSARLVINLTQGIDSRMILVLEGISRLEASSLMAYISVKIPRWIGIYHSPEREQCIKHVGEGIDALKFHVWYTIGQYFILVYCMMLPFSAHPQSAILGICLGFVIELLIVFANSGGDDDERQFRVASIVSMVFAFLASVLFADGCHFIQLVWGKGLIFSEIGLGIASFFGFFAVVTSSHFFHLQRTVRKLARERRISSHDKKDKMSISIIREHIWGSHGSYSLTGSQRATLEEEDDETESKTLVATTIRLSLFKQRLLARTHFAAFSRFEYYVGVFVSIASLIVTVINIGATKQMNVVRMNYSTVHHTLYGSVDMGEVCAFNEIGGEIKTFHDSNAAKSAGYTVAHCGACGQCSTWNDLRLQYTTRNFLAKESAKCAKKSLILGQNAVHACLQEEPIGFSDQCASCWTADIMCARKHCAFIFLQSNMINTVSNFQVGGEIITASTCEEAMCEIEFVPCSGANRRRMNITSSITRPDKQLCNIVGVDWATIFKNDIIISPNDHDEEGEL